MEEGVLVTQSHPKISKFTMRNLFIAYVFITLAFAEVSEIALEMLVWDLKVG